MSQRELDQAIAEVRGETVDEKAVRDAAGRVFRNLFDTAYIHDSGARIRSCADFQALIPAYLNLALTPARALLLEDHVLGCVDCRRILHEARSGKPLTMARAGEKGRRRVSGLTWALAASLAIGVAIGLTGGHYGLLPGQHAVRATVASVEGKLYRLSGLKSSLLTAGALITNADELRTDKGSRAILRLVGGGEIELAERSDVSVSRNWQGMTVHLQQGRAIVQTLDGRQSALYVSSGDMRVPVRNAVLSLDHGIRGSRIALAKGSAQVEQGQRTFQLAAGQQAATDGLENVSIASEFAWSQNADSYLTLLNELSLLQKQIQAIPGPGLRYSTDLAKYVPENAAVYAAIPNLGGTLAEAKQIFDERLAQSEVLRNWWNQKPAAQSAQFDRAIAQITSISHYLGDEVVFAFVSSGTHQHQSPLFLADIRQPGLADYIQQNLPSSAGIQIVDNAAKPPVASGKLLVSLSGGVLVGSDDPAQLKRVAQIVQGSAAGGFLATPFYARIAKAYAAGAGYLLAVDLEQIVSKSVSTSKEHVPPGLNNVQYLVLERRDAGSGTETRAALSFDGTRQGIASWLGAPGPMGSLSFVSPDAALAISFVMKTPRAVMEELINFVSQSNADFSRELSEVESNAGVSLLNDVAAPLGNDATFAIDGPLLPVPSWKIAIEVNDPERLQQTLATLVDHFNQQLSEKRGNLQLGTEQVNSRTFYSLRSDKAPNLTAYYTFVDGYLLAAPSEGNLLQAIQNRQTGYVLAGSANFRNQLPADRDTNFSAIVYTNAGSSLGPLAQQLKGARTLSPAQQQSLSTFLANSGPGLVCVYGEPDRIVAASRGSFLGFNLGTLAGIHQGNPVLPLIASSATSVLSRK
jgi:hypothetical protein